jgi:hypothetical protein
MITEVRSALICDDVSYAPGVGTSFVGVLNRFVAYTRPGVVDIWLTFQVAKDATPTRGRVRVQAPGLDETLKFDLPDPDQVSFNFPVRAPLPHEGQLVVTIEDERRRKPWRFTWPMTFDPAAEELPAHIREKLRAPMAASRMQ